MLFHLGALWRLNELKCLQALDRVSSVSGGSITAGVLGHRWGRLAFADGVATQFDEEVVAPLRALAGRTLDVEDALKGLLLPGTAADRVAGSYRDLLFGGATLPDLPDAPRFVINATNLQSGVLWRFSKPYIWDWRVGRIEHPIDRAGGGGRRLVGVSTGAGAQRGWICAARDFVPGTGVDLQKPPFTEEVFLADGGVYDDLGLETAWKEYDTVLVSDGGSATRGQIRCRTPTGCGSRQRVIDLVDNQVREPAKAAGHRRPTSRANATAHTGASHSHIADYHVDDALRIQPEARPPCSGGSRHASERCPGHCRSG